MNYSRGQWLTALSRLVSPAFPEEAEVALLNMLPALHHLPEWLFTDETLTAMAMVKTRQSVPSFAEITGCLAQFRGDLAKRQERLALPNPGLPEGRGAPTPDEVAYVANALSMRDVEIAERQIEERRKPDGIKLPDVSLKGEHLQRLRAQRGKGFGG